MRTAVFCLTCCIFDWVANATVAAPPVDFNRDIRPILSKNCFPCHGPDSGHRVSKLRLDSTILQNDLLAFCQDKATALPNKMVFGYFLVLGSRRGLSESPPTLLGGAQLTPQERAQRRLVKNAVVFGVCLLVLVIVFYLFAR